MWRNCYRRAAECHQLAEIANKEADRQFYREREQAWVKLALSYQLSERLDLVIAENAKRQVVIEARPWPTCKKVTAVHYSTVFVCTNSRLVFEDEQTEPRT